jgi:Fe-S-cluster containining protein
MSDILRRKILALYEEVDRAVAAAGPICQVGGRCCRFREFGHVLFLSNLEANVLLGGAPAYQAPATPDLCPFQKGNLCTARESRPLGCRIYFCDPSYQETGQRLSEEFLHSLKQLGREHGLQWRYAPLHFFLNNPELAVPLPLSQVENHLPL